METVDVRGLLSLLLADGHFVKYRGPAGGYVQLTLTAGTNESAFLEEKAEELRRFLPTKARISPYRTAPRRNGSSTEVLRFRVSSNRLRPIYNMLYPQGQRRITQMVLDMLGGRAAAWLWAEGLRLQPSGAGFLARVGRSDEEALIVSRWLSMLTGAQGELNCPAVYPRLAFTPHQVELIQAALLPYAPRTRRHLFQENCLDLCFHRPRRRLLPGAGPDETAGEWQDLPGDPAA